MSTSAAIIHVTLKHLLLALASIVSSKEKSDNIIEFVCVRARSIGLIRIRRTPPFFSDEAFDWAHPYPDESSELAHPAHPRKSRMSSDQGVVKYGTLQLPGSDELDTTWPTGGFARWYRESYT